MVLNFNNCMAEIHEGTNTKEQKNFINVRIVVFVFIQTNTEDMKETETYE